MKHSTATKQAALAWLHGLHDDGEELVDYASVAERFDLLTFEASRTLIADLCDGGAIRIKPSGADRFKFEFKGAGVLRERTAAPAPVIKRAEPTGVSRIAAIAQKLKDGGVIVDHQPDIAEPEEETIPTPNITLVIPPVPESLIQQSNDADHIDQKEFAKELRTFHAETGVTKRWLSIKANCKPDYVDRVLSGHQVVTPYKAEKLRDAMAWKRKNLPSLAPSTPPTEEPKKKAFPDPVAREPFAPLNEALLAYAAASGIGVSSVAKAALGDSSFIAKCRKSGEITVTRAKRLRDWMDANPILQKEPPAAPEPVEEERPALAPTESEAGVDYAPHEAPDSDESVSEPLHLGEAYLVIPSSPATSERIDGLFGCTDISSRNLVSSRLIMEALNLHEGKTPDGSRFRLVGRIMSAWRPYDSLLTYGEFVEDLIERGLASRNAERTAL